MLVDKSDTAYLGLSGFQDKLASKGQALQPRESSTYTQIEHINTKPMSDT